jgi:hypothetical protein
MARPTAGVCWDKWIPVNVYVLTNCSAGAQLGRWQAGSARRAQKYIIRAGTNSVSCASYVSFSYVKANYLKHV